MATIAPHPTPIESPSDDDRTALMAKRLARRSTIKVKRLHHHALRTDDMESTRHFYEDLLGMPMVSTLTQQIDPTTGKEAPYLHCFFEMGDGSAIAFFEFVSGRDKAPKVPQDAMDHHLAISVPNFDDIQELKARLEAGGVIIGGIDHGFCYSFYVRDPNDMLVELVYDPDNELEINEEYARNAKAELERWKAGDLTPNLERDNANYPWKSSSIETLMSVLPEARPTPTR